MRTRVWVLLMVLCSSIIQADDKCEHAVDQADSLNVNAKECDGEKSGLNAVIHNYFNREAKGGGSSSSSGDDVRPEREVHEIKPYKRREVSSSIISNAEDLTHQRYQLMRNILELCPVGFRLSEELVVPAQNGFSIKLIFDCI